MSLPNNCDIFILSHNSKQYTKSVYDSLIQQHQNVFVLENSYIESEKFQNESIGIHKLSKTLIVVAQTPKM